MSSVFLQNVAFLLDILSAVDRERLFRDELMLQRQKATGRERKVSEKGNQLAERTGVKVFRISPNSVYDYEKNRWPTFPKMITVAAGYGLPLSHFAKLLGITDSEICGHAVDESQQPAFDRSANPSLHVKLEALLKRGGAIARIVTKNLESSFDEEFPEGLGGGEERAG